MYVNLQDVIDILNRYGQALSDPPMDAEEVVELKLIHKLRQAIAVEVKAADVEPVVHTHWIHRNGEMYCSACGGEALMDEVYYQSPYCPDCGARIDGGNK